MSEYLELYDYRSRVAAMYRERTQAYLEGEDDEGVLRHFREARDDLFANHPQSALDEEQKRNFRGLNYFPYNPAMLFIVEVDTDVEPVRQQVVMNADESMTMTTVGRLHFAVEGQQAELSVYWLEVYGGGLFCPSGIRPVLRKGMGVGATSLILLRGVSSYPCRASRILNVS